MRDNLKIGWEPMKCGICGKDYMARVINHHITYPHLCSDCILEALKDWEKENEKEE